MVYLGPLPKLSKYLFGWLIQPLKFGTKKAEQHIYHHLKVLKYTVTIVFIKILMHLFLFEHWRMTVCVNNIKSNYSSGGKDWVSVIFGFNNNFILLYSLKQIKDDILEMSLFCTVAVFWGFFYIILCVCRLTSPTHIIVKTSRESELGQSAMELF